MGLACERFLSEGYRVLCVDNLRTGSLEKVARLGAGEPDFEYTDHDLSSHTSVPRDLADIYRFASPTSPKDFSC